MVAGGKQKILVFACVGIAVATVVAGIIVWRTHKKLPPKFPGPSPSKLGIYDNAAISCDAPACAEIGVDILKEGGNVVDAAIATLLCQGVMISHSMGVGGGFFMVYYNASSQNTTSLNAREKAPFLAHEDMFDGDENIAQKGPLAVAVPGELKGYWAMYNELGSGRVSWSRLLEPTIAMCENGFPLSRATAAAVKSHEVRIKGEPSLREIFVNLTSREIYKEGDIIKRPQLAETLKAMAKSEYGGELLYMEGEEIMMNFVDDLQERWGEQGIQGIISYDDMTNYTLDWPETLETKLDHGFTHYSLPPPSSGILLSFVLKLMDGWDITPDVLKDFDRSALIYHRFAEALKHAYAKRTLLGDLQVGRPEQIEQVKKLIEDLTNSSFINDIRARIDDTMTYNDYEYYGAEFYQPEDHGTSHLSIIGENGDAIGVTSTINLWFGASIRSRRTGIIYNDEMDDFSSPNITNNFGVPPSPNNFIMPGKTPVSSMAPSIFVDPSGKARLVIGGAGGTHITTGMAYVAMRNLWMGQDIKEAIDTPRLHHQLYPMNLSYETGFPLRYVETFERKQHVTKEYFGDSVVVGVSRGDNGSLFANSDFRKGGEVAGY